MQKLEEIKKKKTKRYNGESRRRLPKKDCFRIFYLYNKTEGVIQKGAGIKLKYYREPKQRVGGWTPPYKDIPLSEGQIRMAVQFGKRKNFLKKRGNRYWFTNIEQIEKKFGE